MSVFLFNLYFIFAESKEKDENDGPVKLLKMPVRGPASSRKLNKLTNETLACTPRTTKSSSRKTLPVHLFDSIDAESGKRSKTSRRGVGMSPFMTDFSPLIKHKDDFYYNTADAGIFKTLFPKTSSESLTSNSNVSNVVMNENIAIFSSTTTPIRKGKLHRSVSSPCVLHYLENNGSIVPKNQMKPPTGNIVCNTTAKSRLFSEESLQKAKIDIAESDEKSMTSIKAKNSINKENIKPKKEKKGLEKIPEKNTKISPLSTDKKCDIHVVETDPVIISDDKNNIVSQLDDGLAKLEKYGFQTDQNSQKKERTYNVKGRYYKEVQVIGKGGSCKLSFYIIFF